MTKEREINAMGNLYNSFFKILNSITIKYSYIAQQNETLDSKRNADNYISTIHKRDTIYYYNDYTRQEVEEAYMQAYSTGIDKISALNAIKLNKSIIDQIVLGDSTVVPKKIEPYLLEIRRKRVIRDFEEKNNYYRMLNGYPDTNDKNYFYITEKICRKYNLPDYISDIKDDEGHNKIIPLHLIPIHKVQDLLNSNEEGRGEYIISVVEGSLYLDKLRKAHPDKKYLQYIGSRRISIEKARSGKNFEIIHIDRMNVKQNILDSFIDIYAQCRDYFMKVLYMSEYHTFFTKYEEFCAMCIMVMTLQQVVDRQEFATTDRNFFDIEGIRALYEAYSIPYDLNIDEDTQNVLLRNLNLFIQHKATDKDLYNIAELIGFSNIKIYKYFLGKEAKYDSEGLPIVEYTTRYNTDTGEEEKIFDIEKMYDIYFHKKELKDDNFIESFNTKLNKSSYDDITSNDPFWWEDEGLLKRLWDTEYNYVESKYLGIGISYSLTEVLYENILLIKAIMDNRDKFKEITVKLPRIVEATDVPLFDTLILLLCLTAAKHNLYGEIITIPTQVISVLDYIKNQNGDTNLDTLKFNYNYFFHPDEKENKAEINKMKDKLIQHENTLDKTGKLYTNMAFNFKYIKEDNLRFRDNLVTLKKILGKDDYERFIKYIGNLNKSAGNTNEERVKTLNIMFRDIKHIHQLLEFYMVRTDDRHAYDSLKQIHDALFYSREISDMFTITGENTGVKRTAYTYFEYLNYINPKLYNAVFSVNMEDEYQKYLKEKRININKYSFTDFTDDVERGNIFIDYSNTKEENDKTTTDLKDDKIYYYVNHIIGRLSLLLKDVKFMYLMANTSTPLEDLLIRLIKFFKSYTVDLISVDKIIICDFKPEQTLRLYDEVAKIIKLIETHERLDISYDDTIHAIWNDEVLYDRFKLITKMYYNAFIRLDGSYGTYNSMRLKDDALVNKNLDMNEEGLLKIFDTMNRIESINSYKEHLAFKDKVLLYYDE